MRQQQLAVGNIVQGAQKSVTRSQLDVVMKDGSIPPGGRRNGPGSGEGGGQRAGGRLGLVVNPMPLSPAVHRRIERV